MSYEVRFDDPALDDLGGLPRAIVRLVMRRIEALAEEPRPSASETLSGKLKGLRKLRVGDYRVCYRVNERASLVTIVEVGHRRDIYKRLARRG